MSPDVLARMKDVESGVLALHESLRAVPFEMMRDYIIQRNDRSSGGGENLVNSAANEYEPNEESVSEFTTSSIGTRATILGITLRPLLLSCTSSTASNPLQTAEIMNLAAKAGVIIPTRVNTKQRPSESQ